VDHVPTPMRARRHVGEPVGVDAKLCPCAAGRYTPSRRRRLLSVADDSHASREGGPVMWSAVGQGRRASLRQGACCFLTILRRDPRSQRLRAAACACATSPSADVPCVLCRALATGSARWRGTLACAGRVWCAHRCGLSQNFPACWRSCTGYAEESSFTPLRFGFVIVGVFFCLLFEKGMAMPAKPRKKPPPQTTSDYLSTLEHTIRQLAYGHHTFTVFVRRNSEHCIPTKSRMGIEGMSHRLATSPDIER
jgi:hypothetical protein